MATVKFFYIEDDTAVLFGANGTALTASLAAVAGFISDIKFPIPTFPLWAFFLGLVFAFLSKAIITIYNGDVREREKGQSIRDFVMEVADDPNMTNDLRIEMNAVWAMMEDRRKKLLSLGAVYKLEKWRAVFYFGSAICFLLGTSSILLFVASISPGQSS
ncbi:hypothetical protein [Aminobacter aminovorans]|uniref:hypothetical protein n=1 Tax=Aminobacter aminovorans TaxID=83263 RepID=UPI00285A0382|nr:hypothetical protein [Aminobacter aminovorans]MDR7222479.1 hypothetical protein [Aminobacter aminovorans]